MEALWELFWFRVIVVSILAQLVLYPIVWFIWDRYHIKYGPRGWRGRKG